MKIEINKVAEILKRNELDPKTLRQIVEEMNALTQRDTDDAAPPAEKKQYAILVSDPEGKLAALASSLVGGDFAGWVVQLPESESVATVEDRIRLATYEYNQTRKGRMHPSFTVGESLEHVPAKHFKEQGLTVRTKTPILVLRTDNIIPRA